MAAVFKYSALVLYAAATSFACFVVFTSSAGNYDASTEGLLPLLQIGTEALYSIIVISVYTIARMHGRDNLKTFYFISAVTVLSSAGILSFQTAWRERLPFY